MLRTVAEITASLGIFLLALWGILSAVWKRADVSWYEFMISGPLIFFQPAKYTRRDRARHMRILVICALGTFIAGWALLWLTGNGR